MDEKKLNIYDVLFLVYLMPMVACKAFGLNKSNIIYIICYGIGLFIILINAFIRNYYNKKFFYTVILCLVASGISLNTSQSTLLLPVFVTIFAAYRIKYKRVLNILCMEWIALFLLNFILITLGVKSDAQMILYSDDVIIGTASTFGYGHKNQLAVACITCLCAFIYLNYEKLTVLKLLLADFFIFSILYNAKSRMGYVMLICTTIFVMVFKSRRLNKIGYIYSKFSYPLLMLISIVSSATYTKFRLSAILDTVFTTRVRLGYYALCQSPISLFGKNVDFVLDNFYIYAYIRYGIVMTLITSFIFTITLNVLAKKRMERELVCLLSMFLVSYSEGAGMNPFYNVYLIFVSYALDYYYSKSQYLKQNVISSNLSECKK